MIETNIHLVSYGKRLYLDVRRVQIDISYNAPDIREKVCSQLRRKYFLAAVPVRESDPPHLFVAGTRDINDLVLEGEDWRAVLKEVTVTRLNFAAYAFYLAQLFERELQIKLAQRTDYWTLDSPRIWYESVPFKNLDGVAAFRRFRVSVVPIPDVGLGIVTHVSTAFFSEYTVADFFDAKVSDEEQKSRQRRFEEWRQGTLDYDLQRSHHKCHFKDFAHGRTCATTPVRYNGTSFDSLLDYYEARHPHITGVISPDSPVAYVTFSGLDSPQPVAANRLRLRLMNNALPDRLRQVDKIPPHLRVRFIEDFWRTVGTDIFSKQIDRQFWQPPESKIIRLEMPALLFGNGQNLPPPHKQNTEEYKQHFRRRLKKLNVAGCYHVPPTMERTLILTYPSSLETGLVREFADLLTEPLKRWTGKELTIETRPYQSIREAIDHLNQQKTGMVIFVFDDVRPEAYYLLSAELKNWHIKRITSAELRAQYKKSSFVTMNALDVLQQLNCVPWIPLEPLNYQAQLAIDVGVDRRYFALSLMVCRPTTNKTNFLLETQLWPKPDSRRETIERTILRDKIVEICQSYPYLEPLESILGLRDGRQSGKEGDAIRDAETILKGSGFLTPTAKVDIVDYGKWSMKSIRLWEREKNRIENVLEGTPLLLDDDTVILTNTGAATLHNGTATPLALTAAHEDIDMRAVVNDIFVGAQMNWSSPAVAQRSVLSIRQTDALLVERRAQEVRGLR